MRAPGDHSALTCDGYAGYAGRGVVVGGDARAIKPRKPALSGARALCASA